MRDGVRSLAGIAICGYFVLPHVFVNAPELDCEPVAIRVKKKVFWVFDNTDSNPENAPVLVARGVDGQLVRPPLASFPLLDEQLAQIPIQGQA